jgi:hypothetical protein
MNQSCGLYKAYKTLHNISADYEKWYQRSGEK